MGVDLSGKVAIVTGAGAGLGRAEAEALGAAGAHVLLNDLPGAADEAVASIRAAGGSADVVEGDIGARETADALMSAAVDKRGRLDIVVNNAGMLRDKMIFNMSDEEWDAVIRVHLRGHFLLSRNAGHHWRNLAKEQGAPVDASIVNTASEAFLVGSPGQPNYSAAKAGIVALTLSSARGLGRSGVRANAICPRARTAMTEEVFGDDTSGKSVDPYAPEHVAPLVTYLASSEAARVTGQVFVVYGGMVALLAPPTVEQRFDASAELWTSEALGAELGKYFADRDPQQGFAADSIMQLTI